MELRDYLQLAKRRGWIVILVAVVAAVSAYAFCRLQTPLYRSTMQLTVLPARVAQTLEGRMGSLREIFERDRAEGLPGSKLPGALARKMPKAVMSTLVRVICSQAVAIFIMAAIPAIPSALVCLDLMSLRRRPRMVLAASLASPVRYSVWQVVPVA